MQEVPDAPWIREAEMYGIPPYDDVPDPVCPICGQACETIYMDADETEVGCDQCIQTKDAWEWRNEHKEE